MGLFLQYCYVLGMWAVWKCTEQQSIYAIIQLGKEQNKSPFSDVLLTVHVSIILVINQLNA